MRTIQRVVCATDAYGAAARDALVAYAAEHDVGLVVIAAPERLGVRRLRPGSVAEQAVQQLACPVLMVRSGEAFGGYAPVVVGLSDLQDSDHLIEVARNFAP